MDRDPALEVDRIKARLQDAYDYMSSLGIHDGGRAARIAATRDDPTAFAWVYLRRHITDKKTKRVTFSRVHIAWAKSALSWRAPSDEPMGDRRSEIAPREMGKTTWHFLLLPMWAAAFGHVSFIAAFADTGTQAETHLATFKSELDGNVLLRNDFPDLVLPKTRGRGTVEADRVSLFHAKNGFVFAAAGMDSSNLGLKIGDRRPELIILDDIEPHEAKYGPGLAKKRLDTLVSAILPLNIYAHVILVGTVTMVGSIVHQIVKTAFHADESEPEEWVAEQRITARHFDAIVTDDDGEEVSIWPEKWPIAFLQSIRHTRTYAKNYANNPLGADGDYWNMEDIVRAATLAGVTRVLVSVDPAVTQKASSDFTGVAVIGWSPSLNKCIVLACKQVKLAPDKLRLLVINLAAEFDAGLVLVETNQGGDLWSTIFWGMPIPLKWVHQTVAKEVRAADVLNHYQRGRVLHLEGAKLAELEGQLVAFPNAPHDDMVDAVGSGVRYFLSRPKKKHKGVAGAAVGYAA
ncbi:MAG: hypothetical protein JWO98_5321 [Frankiales bacterium]|nr:hypothetical protein [Frankiales bacterium]